MVKLAASSWRAFPPSAAKRAKRPQVRAIAALLVLLSTAVWLITDRQGTPLSRAVDSLTLLLQSNGRAPYCTRRDIVYGWWEATDRFTSIGDVSAAYGYRSWKHNYCGAPGAIWNEGVTSGKPQEEEDARKISVASPVFVKANKCRYRDANFWEKIILLLRMPSGAYLIGDSLALQSMRVQENLFVGDGPVQVTMQGTWEWYPLSRHLVLDRNHPDTALLLRDAGVSIERLDYPLLSWYRTWHILWHGHLFEAFKGVEEFDYHDQIHRNGVLDWFAKVPSQIKSAIRRVEYKEGLQPEPTSVMFHGGAHFTRKQLGWHLTDDQLLGGYMKTVDRIEEMMRSLPMDMNIYWQATNPGHVDCVASTIFDNSRTDWSSPLGKDRMVYNYDIFIRMVTYLRSRFPDDAPRRGKGSTQYKAVAYRNPPTRLVDTYDMTIKRPDAHRGPPDDCLHYCSTGVPDEWVKYWWHLMLEEKVNID